MRTVSEFEEQPPRSAVISIDGTQSPSRLEMGIETSVQGKNGRQCRDGDEEARGGYFGIR